jgi:hypothetical protein
MEDRSNRAIAIEKLRRLWREGLDSGGSAPPDGDDVKRRGREHLAAPKDYDD